MYKISDFATLSRVSSKMLRHYDELGLLRPAHVDPETDYRFYTAEQLPRLNRIVVLKDLGFSLQQIMALLDDDLSLEQLKGMLTLRRAEVAQRIQEEQMRLAQIDARLAQIEQQGQTISYDILLRSVPTIPVAAARAVVPNDAGVVELLNEVEGYVGRHRARAARPPTVVYYGCDNNAYQVEVMVPINGVVPDAGWAAPSELEGSQLMACLVHTGSDESFGGACAALYEWIAAQGYEVAGPMRERYLRIAPTTSLYVPPAFIASRPDTAIIEIQIPVA